MFAGRDNPLIVCPMLRGAFLVSMGLLLNGMGAAAETPAGTSPVADGAVSAATTTRGGESAVPTEAQYRSVDVAPTRTFIYIGTVSMRMPRFVREGTMFRAPYSAKVFPFTAYNETGVLNVEITDAQLQQLAKGETIEFTGLARRDDGEEKRVTGRATPVDATSGKLKVRVSVSKNVELIFNTSYAFAD